MAELKDIGNKNESPTAVDEGKLKNRISYPSLHIPSDVLSGKEVGETCRLEVIAKITGQQESEDRKETTLEIHKVGYIGKAGKLSREEYDKKTTEEKDAYDKEEVMSRGEEEGEEEDAAD